MLKRTVVFSLLISGYLLGSSLAQPINISTLHQNDQNGLPLPSLLNKIVTVKGEVTASNQFGITASIQDETGGVVVYDNTFATKVNIGDVVTISGTVTNFNGLTELKPVTILEHVKKAPTIQPQVITCRDIATEGANGIENFEGELVRINHVTVNTSAWNVSSSGTNYILTDSSGACEIRIDKDTNISNTSAPGGSFDVIGVIQQYDISSPFTSGYQLLPRFKNDIIYFASTQITAGPTEKNITPYAMDISWTTLNESNSIIMYGRTTNYEIDTIAVTESVIQHEARLTGLSPATVYHIRVGSGLGANPIFSDDYVVITASHPSSTGEMRVYFNKSVDKTYSKSKQAAGNVNFLSRLIQRVNSAKYSIDACFYSITLEEAAQVLIGAYQRGVKVRVIYDNLAQDNPAVQLIKSAGVPVINDTFGSNNGSPAMHNKFIIVDHRDTTSAADDWVWMGSYNLTTSATYDNAENVIEIQDQALAECYTIEFNEMWGSNTDTPDAAKSRFGYRKTNNTPHLFNINGIEVQQYMSPSDNGQRYLVEAIEKSQSSLYFCMLIFNQSEIATAMKTKWTSINNFKVKGVLDSEPENLSYTQYYNLHGNGSQPWNPPADVHLDNETKLLHHKYLIIDGDGRPGQPLLVTGSYNWSNAAENSNDENFLIIKDSTIANLYLQEFAERYHKAGGKENLTVTAVEPEIEKFLPQSSRLWQNYPNPFNQQTTIPISLATTAKIGVEIFNVTGQQIRRFDLGVRQPGEYQIVWDGRDTSGASVTGGIYFYRLKFENGSQDFQIKKMIYLP